MDLSQPTFDELRRLIHRLCGLVISEDKSYLIQHRLGPLVRECGFQSFEQFTWKLRQPHGSELHDAIVAAITTAETSFFRDGHPFEAIRLQLLPRFAERPRSSGCPKVRIWCAAASTGQEPYSLAMLIYDYVQLIQIKDVRLDDFTILATDISARVLAIAQAAEYSRQEVARGLTPAQIARYFDVCGTRYRLKDSLRQLVQFRRQNLIEPFADLGCFDMILCRNVMIYFDDVTRRKVCARFHSALADGGYLLLGSAENLFGLGSNFESVWSGETIFYRKR